MYSSRAAHGSFSSLDPSASKMSQALSRSQSSASRSGLRHFWFQPAPAPVLHPQSERHRSTPCAQLHDVSSTISTSCVGGVSARNCP